MKSVISSIILSTSCWTVALAFSLSSQSRPFHRFTALHVSPSPEAITLKTDLLDSIKDFRHVCSRDGDLAVDFGVKGGELNETTRAPVKLTFYEISDDAGKAADRVISICETLTALSPIKEPTKYIGDRVNGTMAPLNGAWGLLFTTAADASFSTNSSRGDAKAQNVVDAARGRITNVIDFAMKDGKEPLLKQLNVVIKVVAESSTRVDLTFRYVRAVLTKFFFIPVRWSLYIPVPGPFITRCLFFLTRVLTLGRKKKKIPKAYFDVLYLDDDLRVHKTGQDNLFVQARKGWEEASKVLD